MNIAHSSANSSKAATDPWRILVIGPSWVGDMVMAQSLFIRLKEQRTNAVIDVLAPAWSRPILERMPEVNQAIDMPLGHGNFGLKARRALGKRLKGTYQQSIALPNSWKSGLIPWFADIPIRTGWKGEARYFLLNDLRKLNKTALPFMVQRFVRLAHKTNETVEKIALDDCPKPHLVANEANIPPLLEKLGLHRQKPTLILCPGAEFGPAKQWPGEYYAKTALHCLQQGWQVWLMGSPADTDIANSINQHIGNSEDCYNLCGKTSLEEAIDLIACADQVISNDSGLMHIASALNKPVIALYGATSAEFTPPLSENANIVSINVDCGPCFQRTCPEGHHKCMKELFPEQVIRLLS